MKDELRSLNLTVRDVLGVFTPGCLWVYIICTAYLSVDPSALHSAHVLGPTQIGPLSVGRAVLLAATHYSGVAVITLLGVAALTLGIIFKQGAPTLASRLTRVGFGAVGQFPYTAELEATPDLKQRIDRIIEGHYAMPVLRLPGRPRFSAAKRLLFLRNKSLWEEVERIEAEIRMLAQVFFVSVVAVGVGVINVVRFLISGPAGVVTPWVLWTLTFLSLVVVTGRAFVHSRKREVDYTYLNLLLAMGEQPPAAVSVPLTGK